MLFFKSNLMVYIFSFSYIPEYDEDSCVRVTGGGDIILDEI